MEKQIFEYNGTPVTFQLGNGDVMANATQMAKPFGKQPVGWLRIQQSQDYLTELSKLRNCSLTDLVQVNKGGANPGTWMHEDVALEFARWLSPSFAIWCNDRIKELLKLGMTAMPHTIDSILADPENGIKLLTALKEERKRSAALVQRVSQQDNAIYLKDQFIDELMPDANYTREVLRSESTYNTNQIAKELGMSAVTLNRILKEKRVQYRQGGQWLLTAKYQSKGYTKTHTHTYYHSDGRTGTNMQTVWTERGRALIHQFLTKNS